MSIRAAILAFTQGINHCTGMGSLETGLRTIHFGKEKLQLELHSRQFTGMIVVRLI